MQNFERPLPHEDCFFRSQNLGKLVLDDALCFIFRCPNQSFFDSNFRRKSFRSLRKRLANCLLWRSRSAIPPTPRPAATTVSRKFFEFFLKFLPTTSNQISKNDRLWRCDRFRQKIVEIGAILAIFRPFEVLESKFSDRFPAAAEAAAAACVSITCIWDWHIHKKRGFVDGP